MSLNSSIRAIGVVVMLCGIAVGWLYQHSWSVRLTRLEMKLKREVEIDREKLDSLETELMRLQSFCRLESLYCSFHMAESRIGQRSEVIRGDIGAIHDPPVDRGASIPVPEGAVALTDAAKKNVP